MNFFGITALGPQNYIGDLIKEGYHEPMKYEEVAPVMQKILSDSTCPDIINRPDASVVRTMDCYIGRVDGFAYGSIQRFNKMKRKGVLKPAGPADMYRFPPTTALNIGWFICDPALANKTWYKTNPRCPASASPNTLILDKARKSNKYATLY